MPRTTSDLVKGILKETVAVDLTPFIAAANDLVTNICGGSGYSDATLELIERWLSAHYFVVSDKDVRASKEGAGDVNISTSDKIDMALNATLYGQQAMAIDYKGNLAALNKRIVDGVPPKPGAIWLGSTCPPRRLDY